MGIISLYFRIKGTEELDLDIGDSVWYDGWQVGMTFELWDKVLRDFAKTVDINKAKQLFDYFDARDLDTEELPYSEEKVRILIDFFEEMCLKIEELPEDYFTKYDTDDVLHGSNENYIMLVRAVQSIFKKALELKAGLLAVVN